MTDDEITPERRIELLGAALHAIAWQLVEDETDTSDRGVSEEHYRDALERAKTILPTLMPGVVAEEPEWQFSYVEKWADDSGVYERVTFDREAQARKYLRDNAEHVEGLNQEFNAEDQIVASIEKRVVHTPGEWVPVKQEGAENADSQ